MKAIVYYGHGSPDILKCEEIEKPAPADGEVLIKVRAASVNPLDWRMMSMPIPRLPFSKPQMKRPGVDVAGVVEGVGQGVTRFKAGDEVFGGCRGAFADYACAAETKLVMKPQNVTFEEAAAVPVAGLTALQGLRDLGKLQAGQKVLINGASGGVGTFGVQMAKAFGAEVTGVCSTKNLEMVRSLGADRVIDYTREDFTKGGQQYDLIFDLFANHSMAECTRVMTPKGICVTAGALTVSGMLTRMVAGPMRSVLGSQKFVGFIAKFNKDDLNALGELLESGKVKAVIDRCYKLAEVPEAMRYATTFHARGKVVITVA